MASFIIFILCRIVEFPRGEEGSRVPELLRHPAQAVPLQPGVGVTKHEDYYKTQLISSTEKNIKIYVSELHSRIGKRELYFSYHMKS